MKAATLIVALAGVAQAEEANPIEKIIQMIGDLETKIIKEGEDAQKVYEEFSEWCEDTSKDLMFEIKTGKGEVADLQATIEKESANIQVQESKIEELAGGIATDEADLKAATEIRNKEQATFEAEEKDLVETVDILERAIGIIEKEMNGGASMMQLKKAGTVTEVLGWMVQAQSLSGSDAHKLTALIQSTSDDEADGAPDPAAYENQTKIAFVGSAIKFAHPGIEATLIPDVHSFQRRVQCCIHRVDSLCATLAQIPSLVTISELASFMDTRGCT